MPVSHCISNSEGTFYKMLQDTATSSVISFCFTSSFVSAYIIFTTFWKFIQHYHYLILMDFHGFT